MLPFASHDSMASPMSPAQRLGKAAAAAAECVYHTQCLHTGVQCKRWHMDTQLLVAQMVREHARSTAVLDLATAFWEQQSEGEPALRGLVCLLSKTSKTAEPHRAGIQPAVQACTLVAQFAYRTPMS